MVRKRLEDLVRQEAQKSLKPEDEAVGADAAQQTIELEATVVPETDPDPSANSAARRTNQTKADLETTIKELKAALQASEEENSSMEQKTAALQSDLQEQQTLVEKLQRELEQTKQLILKLTEPNSQPTQKENYPPTQKENSPPTQKENYPPTQKENSPPTQKENSPPTQKENKTKRPQNLSLRRIPYHSIQDDSPSTEMTNSDIGWFD